jgi:HSP20 family molecular chaperone IbpA
MTITLPATQKPHSLIPEFSEFFAAFPSFAGIRPMFDTRLMRLEDEVTDGRYEVRAEIPGIDPAKDVDITVRDGQLTIKAQRSEKRNLTADRNSPTARLSARYHCRPALTKTTSRPLTTKASSLSP